MGFSNEWEEQYRNNKHMSIWPWSDLVSYVYRYVAIKDSKRLKILEVGCGAGANIQLFQYLRMDYYAIDGSSSVVNLLKRKFPEYADNILVGDFTKEIPFGLKFDLIVDRAAITHNTTIDISNTLSLIEASLKDDGKFIGIDWFSTKHDDYKMGQLITDDKYTKFMDAVSGQFNGVGNVHFSNKKHLEKIFSKFTLQLLEEKIINTVYPQKHRFSSWNIVASKEKASGVSKK